MRRWVGGGRKGGRKESVRGCREEVEREGGRKEGGGAEENRNFSILPITFQHPESSVPSQTNHNQ